MTVRRTVDLNADLGEEVTDDSELLRIVTSANVACGYHAGNPAIMRQVCAEAVEHGVAVGAQVSYADRENFGRLARDVPRGTLRAQIEDQVGILSAIAEAAGTVVSYVKPHGALYHRTMDDLDQAHAVLEGSGDLPVLGMPGLLWDLTVESGRAMIREGFPDRGYDEHGRLLPRSLPGALITGTEAIVAQAVELAEHVESLCLHGDSPGAVDHARAVRDALEAADWELRTFV